MKYTLLIALSITAMANVQPLIKDPPLIKFKDSEWQCTKEQLDKAREKFSKCYGLTIFKDCYAQEIKKECFRRLF